MKILRSLFINCFYFNFRFGSKIVIVYMWKESNTFENPLLNKENLCTKSLFTNCDYFNTQHTSKRDSNQRLYRWQQIIPIEILQVNSTNFTRIIKLNSITFLVIWLKLSICSPPVLVFKADYLQPCNQMLKVSDIKQSKLSISRWLEISYVINKL